MIYYYWMVGEVVFVILFFSVIIFKLWRNAKNKTGKAIPPETITGKFWYYTKYLLRIFGVGLGTLLGLSLFVMIERNLLSVYIETAPTPSSWRSQPTWALKWRKSPLKAKMASHWQVGSLPRKTTQQSFCSTAMAEIAPR